MPFWVETICISYGKYGGYIYLSKSSDFTIHSCQCQCQCNCHCHCLCLTRFRYMTHSRYITKASLCDVTAMSHVTAKVSCDGAANYRWTVDQLSLDSWPTPVGHLTNHCWTVGQRPLDTWPSQVIWISIYSPYISRRKYRLFLPKKALLHT